MEENYKSLLITEAVHARLKEHCRAKGLKMGSFAENTLIEKLNEVAAKEVSIKK